jgi:hypothetical protein
MSGLYEKHLSQVYAGLLAADELNERRFYMNALLRVVAAVCYESPDPDVAYERSCLVIKSAMEEGEATSH